MMTLEMHQASATCGMNETELDKRISEEDDAVQMWHLIPYSFERGGDEVCYAVKVMLGYNQSWASYVRENTNSWDDVVNGTGGTEDSWIWYKVYGKGKIFVAGSAPFCAFNTSEDVMGTTDKFILNAQTEAYQLAINDALFDTCTYSVPSYQERYPWYTHEFGFMISPHIASHSGSFPMAIKVTAYKFLESADQSSGRRLSDGDLDAFPNAPHLFDPQTCTESAEPDGNLTTGGIVSIVLASAFGLGLVGALVFMRVYCEWAPAAKVDTQTYSRIGVGMPIPVLKVG